MATIKLTAGAFSTVLAALALATNGSEDSRNQPDIPQMAAVVLTPTQGNEVRGTLTLTQRDGFVHISGKVTGLEPGKHGFHIHEFGDLRDPAGKSAGGHFNPEGTKHGGPDDQEHHAGDLGNIEAGPQGTAMIDKKAMGLKLHFVIGRSIVIHGDADDFESQPSGDAGQRVALGVIGFANLEQ